MYCRLTLLFILHIDIVPNHKSKTVSELGKKKKKRFFKAFCNEFLSTLKLYFQNYYSNHRNEMLTFHFHSNGDALVITWIQSFRKSTKYCITRDTKIGKNKLGFSLLWLLPKIYKVACKSSAKNMFGWNLSEVSLPAFILNLEAFRAELFSVSTG